jgi:hypothetical protein
MFKSDTASDYLDLLDKLDAFVADQGSAFAVAPDEDNVGNGRVSDYAGGASSIAEVWTLACTAAGPPALFSVTGSISGSIGPATVGVPFVHAKLCLTLVAGATAFAVGDIFLLCTAPPWTRLTVPVTASATRWRINVILPGDLYGGLYVARLEMATSIGGADECLGSGGTPSASSYSGSNTPAKAFDADNSTYWQANAIPAWLEYEFLTAKAIKEVAITCPTGGAWSNCPGDFTIEYWSGSQWIVAGSFQHESGTSAGVRRTYPLRSYIWQAPGNDGNAEILVGAHPFCNAGAGWYNWRLQGYTGHSGATVDFFAHPGAIGDPTKHQHGPMLTLWNQPMTYWLWANGRRVVVVAQVGSTYQAAYLGLILPFASPGQWPYPLAIGGSLAFYDEPNSDLTSLMYSYSGKERSNFPMSRVYATTWLAGYDGESKLRLRTPDGTWLGFHGNNEYTAYPGTFCTNTIWPYAYGFSNLKANLDGSVPVHPVMLHRKWNPVNSYGLLDDVFAVSGAAGINAESEISIGYDRYRAFPDGNRNGAMDFFAVRSD